MDWAYFSKWLRLFWIVFYAFMLGILAVATALHGTQDLTVPLALGSVCIYSLVLFVLHEPKSKVVTRQVIIERPTPSKDTALFGIIYILRRDDGGLKFGKPRDLKSRIVAHQTDYQAGFKVVNSWVVPRLNQFELIALELTKKYQYHEGNRKELRQISDIELNRFILDFTGKVYQAWKQ